MRADWGRVAIEWTDATWTPGTGCTKVAPDCDLRKLDERSTT
ncbi:MAG: DUF5131 family protein [Rhodobacteraceae bacterium]|nr:DUF5131 family protein [Paracoccaceae bacterium]